MSYCLYWLACPRTQVFGLQTLVCASIKWIICTFFLSLRPRNTGRMDRVSVNGKFPENTERTTLLQEKFWCFVGAFRTPVMERSGRLQDRTSDEHLLHIKSPFPGTGPSLALYPALPKVPLGLLILISVLWHYCADARWSWVESCISALVET